MTDYVQAPNSCLTFAQAALRFPFGVKSFSPFRNAQARLSGSADLGKHTSVASGSPALISGKYNLTTKEVTAVIGSIRLVQRLRYAGWIRPLYASRDALYPAAQIESAQRRMQAGELPPLLPSEIKQRARSK